MPSVLNHALLALLIYAMKYSNMLNVCNNSTGLYAGGVMRNPPMTLILINYPELNVDDVCKLFLKNIHVKWKM